MKAEFTRNDLLRSYPPPIRELAAQLRMILMGVSPDIKEKVNRGWRSISFRHPQVGYFCGIFPFEDHVDLLFEFGVLLPDPEGLLAGDNRQVRYVRYRIGDDIISEPIVGLLNAALALPPSHSMRRGLTQSKSRRLWYPLAAGDGIAGVAAHRAVERLMPNYICVTCGNQYRASEMPPTHCVICEDERQYVNPKGQTWTTPDELRMDHHNLIRPLEPGLSEIGTEPKFAIGQRALLVQAPQGNVLWDCVSLIDDATIETIEGLGGISALAMSHPHMFGSMVGWSHAFGRAPIHLHADYERWVQRPDPVIQFWEGKSRALDAGVTLHRCGGHFEGSTVLLWPEGAEGRGVLLSSDTLHVTPDRRHVSFMYSYPNYIPLSAATIDGIVDRVVHLEFDRIYSHFYNLDIQADAKRVVKESAARYKRAIGMHR